MPRQDPGWAWAETEQAIIAALDLRAEYQALGVDVNGAEPNAKGWLSCHAVGREDRTPSAAINLSTGRYRDLGGEGDSCSLWEFAARFGPYKRWQDARAAFAAKAGVSLPRGRPAADPAEHLEFRPWNPSLVGLWSLKKPGITPEAVQAAGGRLATYRERFTVVALPIYGPGLADADPVGWSLYNTTGEPLPIFRKNAPPDWKKIKQTYGSGPGLIGLHALLRSADGDPAERTVWCVEGPSDLLALWSAIPLELRGEHLVLTNGNGAAERPQGGMLPPFVGCRVRVIRDADAAGEASAKTWCDWLAGSAAEVRHVRLPYPVTESHGRDLRDWLNDGHAFAELLDLADQAEVVKRPGPGEKPSREIMLGPDQERVVDEAIRALVERDIYQRSGVLVEVVRDGIAPRGISQPADSPRIAQIRLPRLREHLSSATAWLQPAGGETDGVAVAPPVWVAQAVEARPGWKCIRRLEGITECPVLRPDGTILGTPGYDPATGLLYEPAVAFPDVPERPTKSDAEQAVADLLEVVADFPFASSDSYVSAWIAYLLTPIARPAFEGPAPLVLIDSNIRGAGKSLLADAVATIVTGRPAPRMTLPPSDDELRKRVTSLAMAGETMVLIDNVAGSLGGAALDAVLTGTLWSDRLLGQNTIVTVPLRAVWCATSNNVSVVADTARRTLPIRLKSLEEHPEDREEFRHPDLLPWIRAERPKLAAAAATILAAYCAAGRPSMRLPAWGSFEGWSGLVRQAVAWVGLPDPAANRRELLNKADRDGGFLRRMIAAWEEIDPDGRGITVSAAFKLLDRGEQSGMFTPEFPILRSVVDELGSPGKPATARSIGMKLHHLRQRVVDGKYFDSQDTNKGSLWHVYRVE